MTIVYPLTAQYDYTELKYSLRSIEKYLPGLEVIIVGSYLPNWITNITWIQLNDMPNRKQLSIRRKIAAALEYSPDIFFMNDDIYLFKDVDPYTYPYYRTRALLTQAESGAKPLMKELEALGKQTKHFDNHYPIRYEKDKFDGLQIFSADCIIKSMYCNFNDIKGTEIIDCKILNKTTELAVQMMASGLPALSTGPSGVKYVLPLLDKMFNKKSRFEI